MEIIVDMRPTRIESARINAPFDKALAKLQKNDYELISLLQNAGLRMQQGKDHHVSLYGNCVKEGALYVPRKGRFITRCSPVLDHPRKATQAHRNGERYFVSNDQARRTIEDSIQISYDLLGIPTNRFDEDAITRFCFGKNAKDYGLFLKDVGILEMPLWFNKEENVQEQKKPYANQLWFSGFDNMSGLNGNWYLHCDDLSRGVK